MGPIEEIGLLKMDFLGLRNLDVIEDAVEIIRRSNGVELDIERIPLDDAKTYEMLARGDSIGVFQLESEGMREAMRKVRPSEFEDIVALVSLYRPGAMRYIDDYANGKRRPGLGPLRRIRACARSPRRPTAAASTRSSSWRSPSRWPASAPPRPTTCARRWARRSAT